MTLEQDPRERARARAAAYRAKEPEKAKAAIRASRAKRPDYMPNYLAGYYQRHKEVIKARVRAREARLGEALKPINAEKAMRRLARKRKATPAWADKKAISAFYAEAARLTAETGVEHEVDHIVPLQSRRVCGLHVENNLQILTSQANKEKGNRRWPDQP